MRPSRLSTCLPLAAALAAVPFIGLHAQANAVNGSAAQTAATAPPAKKALKALNLDDYASWNRIGSTALSRDGKWMTFTYTPNEGGDPVLHVKALDGDKDYVVSLGAAPGAGGRAGGGGGGRGGAGGGNAPSFSDDSRWAAYFVNPAGSAGGAGGGG